ncbi:MFS transporter [Streptomyces noursei]|uniref:MFS transporter n=1 Tax=Streptomyces noursei TaxID=1971 RepID=UPI003812EFA0
MRSCRRRPVRAATGFFAPTAGIGPAPGGSRPPSRSLFSDPIPRGGEAEYFSAYERGDRE